MNDVVDIADLVDSALRNLRDSSMCWEELQGTTIESDNSGKIRFTTKDGQVFEIAVSKVA